MTKHLLSNTRYEAIKQHILDPENSPLDPKLQEQLDRMVSASKMLDKNPVKKHAVALHRKKFPSICLTTAYQDLEDAAKLYNTYQDFNWDFWQNWLLKDITDNIKDCRKTDTAQDRKTIAAEHANLLKAIGEKPTQDDDPLRHEKNQFVFLVQIDGKNVPIDLENLDKLPVGTLRELNRALFGGKEITDIEAEEIMNS